MIGRIRKGRDVTGLLYYLYGPGKSDEHTDPHLVAGWRDPIASLEPPVRANGKRDFRRLSALLNAPLDMTGRRGKTGTVWHCVLSAAPSDRLLTDEEWNAIAAEFMDHMGLARRDDPAGVRWVAVRHGLSKGGIDHIHIAATLVRQDGKLPSVHNDYICARRACHAIERRFGLTMTAPADRTAAARPSRAEAERSARTGRSEPPRIVLRRMVQEAAVLAISETDFFARLREAGALIRERRSDTDPARITGYAVGLPGYTARSGELVWFGGGKLAPDLTLPRLRRRWGRSGNIEQSAANLSAQSARALLRTVAERVAGQTGEEAAYFEQLEAQGVLVRHRYSDRDPSEVTGYALSLPGQTDAHGEPVWYAGGRLAAHLTLPQLRHRWQHGSRAGSTAADPAERQAIWTDIIRLTSESARRVSEVASTDPAAAADVARLTADLLRIGARKIRGPARAELRRAADDFDRAGREAFGAVPAPTASGRMLRTAVFLLDVVAPSAGPSTFALAESLAQLAEATAELRTLQGRAHQAVAARTAARCLRRLTGRKSYRMTRLMDHAHLSKVIAAQVPQSHATSPPSRRHPRQARKPSGPAP